MNYSDKLSNDGIIKETYSIIKKFKRPVFLIGLVLTLSIILLAIFAPLLATDPLKMSSEILKPPFVSRSHIFGTDQFGRDIFTRLIYGARITLLVAWTSAIGAAIFGSLSGSLTGYFGGLVDNIAMRILESIMTFPFIVIALLLATVFIPGIETLIIVFTIIGTPSFAKIIRGTVLSLKQEEYILAARALGNSDLRIIFRHILPNCLHQVLILVTLQISRIIFVEAGLSFIGVGIQPPFPSWGNMLADGRGYMMIAWWLVILPGLALLITVLGANLLADGLQDILNPKSSGIKKK